MNTGYVLGSIETTGENLADEGDERRHIVLKQILVLLEQLGAEDFTPPTVMNALRDAFMSMICSAVPSELVPRITVMYGEQFKGAAERLGQLATTLQSKAGCA